MWKKQCIVWKKTTKKKNRMRDKNHNFTMKRQTFKSQYDLKTEEGHLILRRHALRMLAQHLIKHKMGNNSGVSKSSSDWLNFTGFPGDMFVAFFNVLPGNKAMWRQNPSRTKKVIVFTTVTMIAYQDQLNAGFSKLCEVHSLDSAPLLQ